MLTFLDTAADLLAYLRYKSSYINSLSSVNHIFPSTKLVYLKLYHSGRALILIESMPIMEDNFDAVFRIFDDDFFYTDLIINYTSTEIVQWPIGKS